MERTARHRRLIAIGGLLLAGACGGGGADAAITPLVPVSVEPVRRDTITQVVTLTGRLAPAPGGSALLNAAMDAVVRRVLVTLGDRVRAGQPLLELDAPEAAGQAAALRAQADAARQEAARQRELFAEGITARRDLEEREAAAASAEAAAVAAAATLARARLRSPLDGVVERILAQPGERVAAGQLLAAVVDDRTIDLVAPVPAEVLGLLRVGQGARVQGEGSGESFAARVRAISPSVDTLTNAAQVLIRVTAPGPGLRPGLGGRANVAVDTRRGVLVVPEAALVRVGERLQLFVVGKDSIARGRVVEVGARQDGRAEVRGDLAEGELVVTVGAFGLPDSTRVTVLPPAAEPVP